MRTHSEETNNQRVIRERERERERGANTEGGYTQRKREEERTVPRTREDLESWVGLLLGLRLCLRPVSESKVSTEGCATRGGNERVCVLTARPRCERSPRLRLRDLRRRSRLRERRGERLRSRERERDLRRRLRSLLLLRLRRFRPRSRLLLRDLLLDERRGMPFDFLSEAVRGKKNRKSQCENNSHFAKL